MIAALHTVHYLNQFHKVHPGILYVYWTLTGCFSFTSTQFSQTKNNCKEMNVNWNMCSPEKSGFPFYPSKASYWPHQWNIFHNNSDFDQHRFTVNEVNEYRTIPREEGRQSDVQSGVKTKPHKEKQCEIRASAQ